MALVLVLLLTVVMLLAVTGVSMRASGERGIAASDIARTTALTVAHSGLQRYIAGMTGAPRTGTDSTRHDTTFTVSGGSVTITARRLRAGSTLAGKSLYVVISRGSVARFRNSPTAPNAEQAVAQFVEVQVTLASVGAAFTSLVPADKSGNSGDISGTDACGARAALPGALLSNASYTGKTSLLSGNPPLKDLGTGGLTGSAQANVGIDWASVLNGSFLPADPGYNFALMPSLSAWNVAYPAGMTTYPIARINGDAVMSGTFNNSRGILIVTGNLQIGGSWVHEGILLVGGNLNVNGSSTISGAVISGLNVQVGGVVANNILSGTKNYVYNSCAVDSSLKRVNRTPTPIRNGLVTNYPLF